VTEAHVCEQLAQASGDSRDPNPRTACTCRTSFCLLDVVIILFKFIVTAYLARPVAETRPVGSVLLLVFNDFCRSNYLKIYTGSIFAKFSGLVELWL